jgi:hypothetical protein
MVDVASALSVGLDCLIQVGPGDTLIEIRLGSLDEAPFELKPEAEVWVKRRESWLLFVADACTGPGADV